MSSFALVNHRRVSVLAAAFFLSSVSGLKNGANHTLVAATPTDQRRLARARLPLSFEPNLGQADQRVKFLSRGRGYTLFLTKDEAVLAMQKAEDERRLSSFVRGQVADGRDLKFEIRNLKIGNRQSKIENGKSKVEIRNSKIENRNSKIENGKSKVESRKSKVENRNSKTENGNSKIDIRNWAAHDALSAPGSQPARLRTRKPSSEPASPSVLCLRLLDANASAKLAGLDELTSKSNYFIGNDPKKWRTNVPNYGRVRYGNVYPGVDLVYYGKGGQLEYDFVVSPGADPSAIRLAIAPSGRVDSRQKAEGGSSLHIAANGDLIVAQPGGELRFQKPVVYQEQSTVDSRQSTVQSRNSDEGSGQWFPRRVGLLQPPTEGRQRTTGHGLQAVVDSKFKIQNSKPTPFENPKPIIPGSRLIPPDNPKSKIQSLELIGGRYVLKPDGTVTFEIAPYDRTLPLVIDPVLSYSTFLGGSDMDYANGIAVDASGNAYVTGYTASIDFPVVSAAQSSPGGGTCSEDGTATPCFDAFVSKLNSTGTALIYSTYLGGSDEDYGAAIAVDASGHAYVAGYTYSTDFPVQNALQPNNAGGWDAFVTELSAGGASLIYSTYWGGSLDDIGTGIAVDSSGNAYLSGYTQSTNFPVTSGAFQTSYGNGAHNAFVVRLNSGGAQVGYSTYLGGSGDDYAYAAAVDSAGEAYVTGATNSTNFPTVNAFQPNYAGGQCAVVPNTFPCFDAFVSKLNSAGSALLFSTYLGGTGSDYGYAIALDRSSNAYVTGYTTSNNFPTTPGAFQQAYGGSYDVFVAKLNSSGSTLGYSTYLGGSGTQAAYGIAVDSNGSAYVTGYNYGGNFPTANPVQAQNAGFYDAFVSVLDPTGSFPIFSTYLGGSQDDFGRGIALDPAGNAYVVGATFSTDFPTTSGSFQPSYMGGPYDAFVTKYIAPAMPLVAISPSSYDFGNQAVGTASSPGTISLTNNGAVALTFSSIAASGDFSQTNDCGASLAPSASCTLSVTFTPAETGPSSGSITISDNASPATQTISLTGDGTGALANLSPSSLTFSSQAVGTSSSPQNLTLSNTGSATLTITSIAVSGDFSQSNNCGASLAASSSCTIKVTFTPTVLGSRSGSLTITDNANPTTQTVSLSGTGTAPAVSLSTTSLTFSSQALGTSSSPQNLTLSNTGSASLAISSITVSGDFSQSNNCGASLAANSSCTIKVTFTPTVPGSRSGSVTITDNASPSTQTVTLAGAGTAPGASLSPTSLTFAAQPEGGSSNPQSITLSNTGNATLIITGITISGQFSQTNTCGSSVGAGASCTISVIFKPTTTGTSTGTVTVTDNASPTTQAASLTGTGVLAPAVSLSPTSLTFSSQTLGASSSAQIVTLKNTGKGTLSISSIAASGDFAQTNTCGSSVAASASCTIKVTFKPTAIGTRTGALTFIDNASPSTQTVTLTGTSMGPVVSLSPASLTFGTQTVGASGSPQKVSLKNTGNLALSITSIKASGDFSQINTCGSSVSAKNACTISVTFKPTAVGTRTGAVTITDNSYPTTQSVSLTGTGASSTGVKFAPASLTFPAQTVGTSSNAQTVTLSNTGSATLSIVGITASSDASQTNDCGTSVAVNASCTLSVTFNPTAGGTRAGAVSITDTAAGSPQSVTFTGTGEDFMLTASSGSSTSASVSPGGTATYSLSVLALGGFNQNVALACTGAPAGVRCTASPTSVNFSSPTNVTVTVATAAPSFGLWRLDPPPAQPLQPRLWLLWTIALMGLGSLAKAVRSLDMIKTAHRRTGRSRAALVTFAALLLAVLVLACCGGGGGEAPPPASSGTTPGTYNLSVTGTCSSCSTTLSHSVGLTLIVQ